MKALYFLSDILNSTQLRTLWLVFEIFNYHNLKSDIVSTLLIKQSIWLDDFGIINFMDFEDKKRDVSWVLPYGRINVLLPIPISQYYEYLNKDILLRIGDLVEVPFGKRFFPALVIGSVEGQVEVSKLKPFLASNEISFL